jgi:hypothetical protein
VTVWISTKRWPGGTSRQEQSFCAGNQCRGLPRHARLLIFASLLREPSSNTFQAGHYPRAVSYVILFYCNLVLRPGLSAVSAKPFGNCCLSPADSPEVAAVIQLSRNSAPLIFV